MGKKKLKIYQEDAKLRQTTHWDIDYMTTAEIDALYNIKRSQKTQNLSTSTDNSGVHDYPIRKSNPQPSWQQGQWFPGKAVVVILLRPLKGLADLFRNRVHSPNT